MSKIIIIATIYNTYPQIISSLICQTHTNWNLLLIHDGPNNTGLKKIVEDTNDPRVIYIETEERQNLWGHNLRKWILEEIKEGKLQQDGEYIVITNADNWYSPLFLSKMLSGFTTPKILATYCSSFLHNYLSPQPEGPYEYGIIQSKVELGYIDCGGVMVRKKIACEVGWRSMAIYSDWEYIDDIRYKYGIRSFNKILGTLFVHN